MKLTGQDIHAVYASAQQEATGRAQKWEQLPARSRLLYRRVAVYLNVYLSEQVVQPYAYEPAPWSDEMSAQYEEEWSNADDRFIRPAVDLDRQASALLDEIYGE